MVAKRAGRVPRSFKVNPKLWALFKKTVIEKGFSTCFILETLMQAWVAGAPHTKTCDPSATITIRQKIEYVVDRPRRKRRFTEPLDNCYLNGCWTYRKPEKGEVLSKLGHVAECRCSVCRPYKSKRV